MSTRAQIAVEGSRVKLYRHHDGYPDGSHGVMGLLVRFVRSFWLDRGYDEHYLMAQLTSVMVGKLAPARFTGFGLGTDWHGDVAYIYYIRANGDIEVRVPRPGYGEVPRLSNTYVHYTVPLLLDVSQAIELIERAASTEEASSAYVGQ